MAEGGARRESGISQIGLTIFKSVHTMTLSERQFTLSSDSDSNEEALKGGSIESNGAGQNLKTGSVPTLASVDVCDNNEVEKEEKEVSKKETREFTTELQMMIVGAQEMYPLHFPTNAEHIVTLLKTQKDLDPNGHNNMLQAPIHAIVQRKCNNAKEKQDKMNILYNFLTYSNADVDNPTDCTGRTALHLAADECDIQSVKILLSFDANLNALDIYGKTPLDLTNKLWDVPPFSAMTEKPLKYEENDAVHDTFMDPTFSISSMTLNTGDEERCELIHLLKSLGAMHGRDIHPLPRIPTAMFSPPCENCQQKFHFLSTSPELSRPSIDKYMSSIKYCKSEMSRVVELTDLDGTISPSDAATLAQSMKKLKIYKQAGSRILCLDGGGMRGLIQIEILAQIEAVTGRKITELFDWIIGTSIGGVTALSLVYGGLSYSDLKQIAGKFRTDVFHKTFYGVQGDPIAIDSILKEYLPEQMRMCDISYPRVLVTTVDKSSDNLKLVFFNNCFNDKYSTELVWKVGRYTTSAPIYINEMDNYIDGGILANNPSIGGITRIQSYYQEKYGYSLPISLVVSVGTGKQPESPLGNTDLLYTKSWFNFSEFGQKAKNLLSVFGSIVTNVQQADDICRSYCQQVEIPYFRFNIPLDRKMDLFLKKVEDIVNLVLKTRQHFVDNTEIKELAVKFHAVATASQEAYKILSHEN